jgi:two-component system sensor histidine kinase BaeS
MSLRVRLAAAMALVALLTAVAVAIAAPAIVGRGFAAALTGEAGPGMGQGQGPGMGQGGGGQGQGGGGAGQGSLHWQQVQQETVLALVAVAGGAAILASLVGLTIATRTVRPLGRLEQSAAAVAHGDLDARSGLAGRTDEIGSLARSFDAMAAELAAAEASRRRFFADAAHELKTPLAVIDATTSAVIDGVYEHDDRHLETIRDQARLLARIVDDLRTVSLAESGVLPLHVEAVVLAPVLAAAARDLDARSAAGGPRVEAADPGPLAVRADPDRLRQVLNALGDNALRHAGDGGWVRISAAPAGDGRVCLSVVDSGPGIAAEDLGHVFDRFYQADPARDRSTRTSGLGLAIVRAVVEALGGRVTAGNEPGAGARFDVELPAA